MLKRDLPKGNDFSQFKERENKSLMCAKLELSRDLVLEFVLKLSGDCGFLSHMPLLQQGQPSEACDWKVKETDRFVLRWIKVQLSARITPWIASNRRVSPQLITFLAFLLGVSAGVSFACRWTVMAGCLAAVGQILDGVDGQLARLTHRETARGAFWDSLLDRYADGTLVIGMTCYLVQILPERWVVPTVIVGSLAVLSCNAVSYSTSRAAVLNLDLGKPTLASKGTRTSVIVLGALSAGLWYPAPVLSLVYLAVHPTLTVCARLINAESRDRC